MIISDRFNDIYCHPTKGPDEKHYVFLMGSNLPARWQELDNFTIGEFGFGAGICFWETFNLWKKHRRSTGKLNYISIEGFPLAPSELERVADTYYQDDSYLKIFMEWYRHDFSLQKEYKWCVPDINFELTLIPEEISLAISSVYFKTKIDAWFLDGFSPSKNPEMWDRRVFSRCAELSNSCATVASYSVARSVCEALKNAGFDVQRRIGFPPKRECLVGKLRMDHPQ